MPISTCELILEVGIVITSILIVVNLVIAGHVLHGMAAKLITLGIILFAIDSIDNVLSHFKLDLMTVVFPLIGKEIYHDALKFFGMLFISIGLLRLSASVLFKK